MVIEINIEITFIDSGEIFLKQKRVFNNDKDSIEYLKNIDNQKMQLISDKLKKGQYKPSLILKNANSQYSISFADRDSWCNFKATDKEPNYDFFFKRKQSKNNG